MKSLIATSNKKLMRLEFPRIFFSQMVGRKRNPPWKHFKVDGVLMNSYDFMQHPKIFDEALEQGIHKLLDFDGPIMMDSGGYQFMKKKNMKINANQIISFYEKAKPNFGVVLDHPMLPTISKKQIIKRQRETLSNTKIMSLGKKIWVLGTKNNNADQSFLWDENIPNLTDPDILIIDLQSLTRKLLTKYKEFFREYISLIEDKFVSGGDIVFITGTEQNDAEYEITNYDLCPLMLNVVNVSPGSKIIYDNKKNPFASYLKHVKKFSMNLERIRVSNIENRRFSTLTYAENNTIKDNAGHVLGGTYFLVNSSDKKDTGEITLLPPTTAIDTNDAIDKIIEVFQEESVIQPPQWVDNVSLSGLQGINTEMQKLVSQKSTLESEITKLNINKQKLLAYLKLLFCKEKPLEKAVRLGFQMLGFNEIKRIRENNEEDWIIEFETNPNVKYGVIEVKGSEKRTSHADIVQCNKWVDDYHLEQITTKGIFIPNQNILEEYPASKAKRSHFEDNELKYAKSREICIIPSYVIFEAVNKMLNGEKISRNTIEEKILNTNGVLLEL